MGSLQMVGWLEDRQIRRRGNFYIERRSTFHAVRAARSTRTVELIQWSVQSLSSPRISCRSSEMEYGEMEYGEMEFGQRRFGKYVGLSCAGWALAVFCVGCGTDLGSAPDDANGQGAPVAQSVRRVRWRSVCRRGRRYSRAAHGASRPRPAPRGRTARLNRGRPVSLMNENRQGQGFPG